jgi:sulfur carrier protein
MGRFKYFFVNGQQFCTQHEITVSNLVTYFNFNSSLLVLEYNNLLCNKKSWDNICIQNDDKIEIVTIVGGG